jgi:hypothetical protein
VKRNIDPRSTDRSDHRQSCVLRAVCAACCCVLRAVCVLLAAVCCVLWEVWEGEVGRGIPDSHFQLWEGMVVVLINSIRSRISLQYAYSTQHTTFRFSVILSNSVIDLLGSANP